MAECFEILCEASLEEQQEEVTVLQSIFEDDLRVIQEGDGKKNIHFDLTVKVNVPYDIIEFEAFISVEVFEDSPVPRRARSRGSNRDAELVNDRDEEKENESSSARLLNKRHLDAKKIGLKANSSLEYEKNHALTETCHDSFPKCTKPGFTRSVSLQHRHVKADIRYLTPIHLTCTFPPVYPTGSPPEFSLACLWLTRSQLQELKEKLLNLWTETPNMPIVFTWADWLQNYAYEYLHLGSYLVLKESEPCEAIPPSQDGADHQGFVQNERLYTKLETSLLTILEYDLEMQRQAFRRGTHLCEICFNERNGTEFHFLDECRHFFCTECLKAHCDLHVDGGTVLNLLCPSHDCKTKIPPETLRQVLDAEKLERWERLLLSKTLDVMGGVVYCPRCNMAVIVDEDETLRLGHCPNCFFAFCTECYGPWLHGQPCFDMEADSDSDVEDNRTNEKEANVPVRAAERTRLCQNCSVKRDKAEFHYLYECKHFFCTDCLKAFSQSHVDAGNIQNLACPIRSCKAMIPLEILQEVLDEERFKRCEKLFLAKTLDDLGIRDMDYCPRCTVPLVVDDDETSRHGQCANCLYEFCTECYEPWHHGRPCLAETEPDCGDDETRETKDNLKAKKTKTDSEEKGGRSSAGNVVPGKPHKLLKAQKLSNLSFIRMMKQQGKYQCCPKCRMAVERTAGCDMMHCSQCTASFCWTCGKEIFGYDHFGRCGREEPEEMLQPAPRQEPVEENETEQYLKENPGGKLRPKRCPRCHQWCFKENSNNNHLKCPVCKASFCYQCGKEIKGPVTMHFTAASSCTQHSDD